MPSINKYDVYIFDCDGVILNSNQLKIDAMEKTLLVLGFSQNEVSKCVNYFRNNFGKSRFHHIKVFIEQYLSQGTNGNSNSLESEILRIFSEQCQSLYLEAEITPDFLIFLASVKGKKYIASGSAQEELRQVFLERKLAYLFDGIYGSPATKAENIFNILTEGGSNNAVMFGDALSDLEASVENKIDFIGYRSYSNIPDVLTIETQKKHFPVIDNWVDLI